MHYVYIYLARRHIKYICTQHKTIQIYTENEINPEIKMMNELILHSLQWQIIPHHKPYCSVSGAGIDRTFHPIATVHTFLLAMCSLSYSNRLGAQSPQQHALMTVMVR